MGGKRTGKGKHLHLCAAVLTALAGCATPAPPAPPCPQTPAPARQEYVRLERVQALVGRGDFEEALRMSQEALSRAPRGPEADNVLFDIALLHAHYANPRKDYVRSLGAFSRLVREYPDSPFVDEAKVWIGVLEAFEKAKRVDIEIEQKLKGLGK